MTMSVRFCMVWLMNFDWRDAACFETYDHRFHGTRIEQQEVRRDYCLNCPVKDECGDLAEYAREKSGMWGGMMAGKGV